MEGLHFMKGSNPATVQKNKICKEKLQKHKSTLNFCNFFLFPKNMRLPNIQNMKQKTLVILSTGFTYKQLSDKIGDFSDWILARIPERYKEFDSPIKIAVVKTANFIEFAKENSIMGIIITGSHDMVTNLNAPQKKCFQFLKELLNKNKDLPVLGICYGHQLLAHLLGGCAAPKVNGAEIGLKGIFFHRNNDELFEEYSEQTIPFYCVHYQCAEILPPGATLFAESQQETHHAFRIRNCWGVQFHPEFPMEAALYYEEENAPADFKECRKHWIETHFVNNDLIGKFCQFAEGIVR